MSYRTRESLSFSKRVLIDLGNGFARVVTNSQNDDPRPLGHDSAVWQAPIDPTKDDNVFWIARAGISWGYPDPSFRQTYDLIGLAGKYRTSYHVPYSDQPLMDQLDKIWYAQHPEIDVWPRAVDMEVNRPDSTEHKAEFFWDLSEEIKARDGLRPIFYSRKNIIDDWLRSWTDAMLNDHYWWLAQYLFSGAEHPGPPTLPERINADRIIIHQTSDRKLAPPGLVQTKVVDWDRWQHEQDIHEFTQEKWGGSPPPPLTLEERVTLLEQQAHTHE